jgi:hypothetical protein
MWKAIILIQKSINLSPTFPVLGLQDSGSVIEKYWSQSYSPCIMTTWFIFHHVAYCSMLKMTLQDYFTDVY